MTTVRAHPFASTPSWADDFRSGFHTDLWTRYGDDTAPDNAWRSGAYPTTKFVQDKVNVGAGVCSVTNGPDGATRKRNGGAWVSGGLCSLKGALYGRWWIRARFLPGRDQANVILLWPDHDAAWPPELDVAESFPEDTEAKLLGVTNHWGEETGHGHPLAQTKMLSDGTAFHNYLVDWRPDLLAVRLDGEIIYATSAAAEIPQLPMHLVAQTQITTATAGQGLDKRQGGIVLDGVQFYPYRGNVA